MQHWIKHRVPRPVKNFFNRIFPNLYASVETRHGLSRIDPSRSRLYAWRKSDVIRVNLAGREPGGLIPPGEEYEKLLKEVKTKLEMVIDPRSGRKPIRKVWTRKEVYPLAQPLDDCPDLVIEWADRLYNCDTTLDNPHGPVFDSEELRSEKLWRDEINGNHTLYGIFGGLGKNVGKGVNLGEVDILAVTPSILAALGIPLPDTMPGRPPEGLFIFDRRQTVDSKHDTTNSRPHIEHKVSEKEDNDIYTDEERELIEKRLRDLGYL